MGGGFVFIWPLKVARVDGFSFRISSSMDIFVLLLVHGLAFILKVIMYTQLPLFITGSRPIHMNYVVVVYKRFRIFQNKALLEAKLKISVVINAYI